jgi:hypothetical protein
MQQDPMVGSFLVKLLQWSAAGFKGAQTIEGVLDEAARMLSQKAAEPPKPPPPSPADEKDKASAAKYLAEAQQIQKETALMPNPGAMPGPLPGGAMSGGIAPAGPGPGGPPPAMPLPPQPPMQ